MPYRRQHNAVPTLPPYTAEDVLRIETRAGRTVDGTHFVKCSECGKSTHPDRVRYQNLLPVCRNCD